MWTKAVLFSVTLSLLSNWQWISSAEIYERTEHSKLLDSLLVTLQQLAKFYNREYQHVNLDSIYGVRVVEGALKSTLGDIHSGASVYPKPKVLFTINNLYTQFSGIARKSLQYLETSSPEYYSKFKKVVAEPWSYYQGFKRLDLSVAIPLMEKKEVLFAEEMSDSCMVGLMGSANKTAQPCQISQECWKLMGTRGYKEYVTTHQALFFILGDIQGCRSQLEAHLKAAGTGSYRIEDALGRLCADIYPEMVQIEEEGYQVHERDLFMEQGIVCGMLGYYEYLDKDRLRKILSWKTPRGCYGFSNKRDALQAIGEIDDETHLEVEQQYKQRKLMSMDTRRKLLVESALTDGCMAHMTGVAVGLLGLYVKWMIATASADWEDDEVQGTHVIKARSMYSYATYFNDRFYNMCASLCLFLTVGIVMYILLKRRTRRLIKGMLNYTTRMTTQKDIKYIY